MAEQRRKPGRPKVLHGNITLGGHLYLKGTKLAELDLNAEQEARLKRLGVIK